MNYVMPDIRNYCSYQFGESLPVYFSLIVSDSKPAMCLSIYRSWLSIPVRVKLLMRRNLTKSKKLRLNDLQKWWSQRRTRDCTIKSCTPRRRKLKRCELVQNRSTQRHADFLSVVLMYCLRNMLFLVRHDDLVLYWEITTIVIIIVGGSTCMWIGDF